MIFKGGTALRLCFYEDYRYSADLDFSLRGATVSDAEVVLREALNAAAAEVGFPVLELVDGSNAGIAYQGPLGRVRSAKVDIAEDELVVTTTVRPLIQRYSDQAAAEITTYTLDEVAAEKLRCVIQRLQCRDIFDLHHLLVRENVDVETAWALFDEKARHKNIDPTLFGQRLDEREPRYRQLWQDELEDHLGAEPPAFEETIRQLRRALRDHL